MPWLTETGRPHDPRPAVLGHEVAVRAPAASLTLPDLGRPTDRSIAKRRPPEDRDRAP